MENKYKTYREDKYNNRKMKNANSGRKRILSLALGTLFILEGYLISLSVAKAKNESGKVEVQTTTATVSKGDDKYPNSNDNIDSENNDLDPFNVGSSPDKKMVIDYLASPEGQFIYKYAEWYGVDPNIIAAICMQETSLNHNACIPGGDWYSGYGVGIMQLESPGGEKITAYNYKKGTWDEEYINMENACDLENNIKIGCMIFQNKLKENYGNIFIAIQSYNYGQGMMDMIMDNLYGNKKIFVMQNYDDLSWITEIERAHNNPSIYISNWAESKYGDGKYLEHVLRFCPSNKARFKIGEDVYTIGLDTCQLIDKETIKTR